jgi:hypothetical protein
MKAKYDPEQVTQPLEVARQALYVGGASGTHMAISPFHRLSLHCNPVLEYYFCINVALPVSLDIA